MKRREFITLVGGAAAWPVVARAQQTKMPVIGFLQGVETSGPQLAGFREGLKEAGYVEGRNVVFEYRRAEGQDSRLPKMAAELIKRQVTVIAAEGRPAAFAAKASTAAIPIVFYMGNDPVRLGLVTSLNRPGANITGITAINATLLAKRVEILAELIPTAIVIALLVNPNNPNAAEVYTKEVQTAARTLGRSIQVVSAGTEREFGAAFASVVQQKMGALVIANDPFFNSRMAQLAVLAASHSLPAIYSYREFAAAGGLITYGPSLSDGYRLFGLYVGKILNGSKPADLPVLQPTKFELAINLKTAKALGIAVPPTLIARADEVIE